MTWELPFEKMVSKIRVKELKILKKIAFLNTISTFSWTVAPFLVTAVAFLIYVFSDDTNVLSAEKAFTSLALFNLLKQPLTMLPVTISNMIQVYFCSNLIELY